MTNKKKINYCSVLKECIDEFFTDIEKNLVLGAKMKQKLLMCHSFLKRYDEQKIFDLCKQIFIPLQHKIYSKEEDIFQKSFYLSCLETLNFPVIKFQGGKMFMSLISKIYLSSRNEHNRKMIWTYLEAILEIINFKNCSGKC